VLTVTEIPDQTPHELVGDTASERTERIRDVLAEADIDADYVVEGQTCRDVAFAITNTARQDGADRILMGYPEQNPDITETVEYGAPCDVVFAAGVPEESDFGVVNFGAGGGPHHEALLPLVEHLGRSGDLHLVHVTPGDGGTSESVGATLDRLGDVDCEVHKVSAGSVADGLVTAAQENGGVLLVGASRDRSIRQWVLGSTPDRVVELARDADVPVLIYASETGVPERIEDRLFPVYRYLQKVAGG
jgi:APA family basic amino acid/polyamine antiporter